MGVWMGPFSDHNLFVGYQSGTCHFATVFPRPFKTIVWKCWELLLGTNMAYSLPKNAGSPQSHGCTNKRPKKDGNFKLEMISGCKM